MTTSDPNVTQLLRAWNDGDVDALSELMPLVFAELRKIAVAYFAAERAGHTLQPTAVVSELYLRLANIEQPSWQSRGQFFAAAGKMMRWILVDHARRYRANKRGGPEATIQIEDDVPAGVQKGGVVNLVALDQALSRLEELSPRQSRVVELRFFAGLSVQETAAILGISESLVKKEWRMAKSWLHRQLAEGPQE